MPVSSPDRFKKPSLLLGISSELLADNPGFAVRTQTREKDPITTTTLALKAPDQRRITIKSTLASKRVPAQRIVSIFPGKSGVGPTERRIIIPPKGPASEVVFDRLPTIGTLPKSTPAQGQFGAMATTSKVMRLVDPDRPPAHSLKRGSEAAIAELLAASTVIDLPNSYFPQGKPSANVLNCVSSRSIPAYLRHYMAGAALDHEAEAALRERYENLGMHVLSSVSLSHPRERSVAELLTADTRRLIERAQHVSGGTLGPGLPVVYVGPSDIPDVPGVGIWASSSLLPDITGLPETLPDHLHSYTLSAPSRREAHPVVPASIIDPYIDTVFID